MADQPFGPSAGYKDNGVTLFEYGEPDQIGEEDETLAPADAKGRGRAIRWMIAALNSVEPPLQAMVVTRFGEGKGCMKAQKRGMT